MAGRTTARLRTGTVAVVAALAATLLPLGEPPLAVAADRRPAGRAPLATQTPPPPGPALYDEAVLADDPILYHRFDDTGATAADSSGNGRTSAYRSTAVLGEPGALLDDTSTSVTNPGSGASVVTRSDAGMPSGAAARTIEVWAHPEAPQGLIGYGSYYLETNGNNLVVRYDGDSTVTFTNLQTPTSAAWHHYVVSLTATGVLTVYVDGQAVGTHTDPAVTTALGDGFWVGGTGGGFDEAAVYDTALGAERVQEHWFRGSTRSHDERCPTGEDARVPADPYGEAVLASEPSIFLRPGDAPQTEGERVAYDWSGGCHHGATSPDAEITDPATVGGTGAVDLPDGSPEPWAVAAHGPWMPTTAAPVSLEMWAKGGTDAGTLVMLGSAFHLETVNANRLYFAVQGVVGAQLDLPYPLRADRWHHFAVTSDGTRVTVFFDGRIVWSANANINVPISALVVGNNNAVDDIAVYPSALSAQTIAAHWGAGAGGVPADDCPVASGGYADEVMVDEPAVYYRLGERVTDPTARVAVDSSGGCRHGAYHPDATGTDGLVGTTDGAADSGGTNLWVAGASARDILGGASQPFTAEVWAKRTAPASHDLIHLGGSVGLVSLDSHRLRLIAGGGVWDFEAQRIHGDGQWHHFAITYDGTTIRVHLDAIEMFSVVRTLSAPEGQLLAGSAGVTDELAVYPSVLSAADLSRHWAAGRAGIEPEPCPVGSAGYAGAVVADEPVAYYRLGELAADPSHTVAVDSSGSCRHGSIDSAASASAGALTTSSDGAVTSSGNYAAGATVAGAVGPEALSVEVWTKQTATGWKPIVDLGGSFHLASNGAYSLWIGQPGNFDSWIDLPYPHLDGQWHQWVVTNDGETTRIYLDAIQVWTGAADLGAPNGWLMAGSSGAVDELSLYDTALDPGAIAHHWAAGRADLGSEPCPVASDGYGGAVVADEAVAYYPLGERSVDPAARVAVDASGSCRHGSTEVAGTASNGAVVTSADGSMTSSGNYAAGATVAGLVGPEALSVEVWTKQTATGWKPIVDLGGSFHLASNGVSTLWIGQPGNFDSWIDLPRPHLDGQWHQWVVTNDGIHTVVYMDAIPVWSGAADLGTPNGWLMAGSSGAVDELSLYDTALDPPAVARHWAAGRADLGLDPCPVATGGYGSTVIADEPSAYYRLGERSEDPTAQVAVDSSGHCRHGSVDAASTGIGGALTGSLDGATASAGWTLGSTVTGVLGAEDDVTVETWWKSTSSGWRTIASLGGSFLLASSSAGTLWMGHPGQGDHWVGLPTDQLDGQWHHFVITNDGETTRIYFDGVQVWTKTVDMAVPAGALLAGEAASIDELAVYPTALTPSQVGLHWDARSALDTTDPEVSISVPDEAGYSASFEVEVEVAPVAPANGTPAGLVVIEVDGEPVGEGALIEGTATVLVDEPVEPGEHLVTALYSGGPGFHPAESDEAGITILASSATVEVTTDPSPSAIGADVEVTVALAPMAPATAAPDGDIELYLDDVLVDTTEAADGEATFTLEDLDLGTHELRADLAGSDRWLAATGSVEHRVGVGSVTTLDVGPAVVFGQDGSATVVVTGVGTGPTPSGTVRLLDGDDLVAEGELDGAGRADLAVSGLTVGEHELVAQYLGDALHVPSTSDPDTATVIVATSHVTLGATPNPSAPGQDVVLSAQVRAVAPGAGTPSGFVTFFQEGETAPLGTAVLGPTGAAAITTSFPDEGTRRLTAVYGGDSSFSGRTSAVVEHRVSPATTLDLVADPTAVAFGEAIELTATATATGATPIGEVTFLADGDELATVPLDVDGVAVHEAMGLGHGTHTIEARFSGAAFGPSSDEVALTVDPAETAVVLTLDPEPSAYGDTVTATVAVEATGVDPAGTTGFVTLSVDEEPVATLSLADGEVTHELTGLDVGEHDVEAAYGGRPDGDLAPATDEVTHTVARAATEVVVDEPARPTGPGDEVELVARVGRATGGEDPPEGEVTFVADGTTPLGTAPLVDGVAMLTTDDLDAVRTWSITAEYDGDDRHLGSESDAVEWIVLEGVVIIVTPPAAPTDLGTSATFTVQVDPVGTGAVPTGEVALLRAGRALARATLDGTGAATLATHRLLAGETELEVGYAGDLVYAPRTSAPVPHDVERSPVVVTVEGTPDPAVEGGAVSVVARVVGAAHHVVRPTGTVRIGLPSGATQDVELNGDGVASVRVDGTLAVGVHDVSARYDGDANHDGAPTVEGSVEVVEPVDVGIAIEPMTGTVGMSVTAAATGSPGSATLAWDFGDGGTATGPTATHTYTDAGLFTVTLRAIEGGATTYVTARVEVGPDLTLAADAGADQIVADGVPALFDGRGSAPQPGIDSWLWELGDGTTSSEPNLTHTYSVPGTYVVRLTVTDDGTTASDEVTVVVEAVEPEEGLHVSVTGADGPLAGADVLVVDGLGQDHRAATDGGGEAVLARLADHQYSVYAIAPGYRPKLVKATVTDGYGTASLTLEQGERGITEVASRELTAQEAEEAGVDLDDPDNSHVYEFEVWLDFVHVDPDDDDRRGILVNQAGDILSPECTPDWCHFDTDSHAVSVMSSGGPMGGGGGKPSLIWIVMPGRAQWMKEMFEVQMVVQNLTDPDFAFEDGAASITLPAGLSLATLEDPQTTTVEMDDIVGGSSGAARWIVRGDAAGSYEVDVDYTGSIYPLGTSVRFEGRTAAPLKVWGPDALELEVTAEEEAVGHAPYLVDVEVTNVADVPVHNVALDLLEQGAQEFIYQPRQQLRFFDDELAPGESLLADGILVPHLSGILDVEEAFVQQVGGTATLPGTVTAVPAGPPAPDLCTAGKEVDEDGQCSAGDNPFGEVDLTWEPTGGPYRVYRTDSDAVPFPRTPIGETSDTSFRYRSRPGEGGFFAVTEVQGDEEVMVHNAVSAATGSEPSAQLDLFVECLEGSTMQLRIDYHDDWYPLEQYRVVTGLDQQTGEPLPGQFLGNGELSGMEGTTDWPLAPAVFAPGDHLTHVPTEDGGTVAAAMIYVQVRNVHDGVWAAPTPVLVFQDCEEPFEGIPAKQTFGTGCKSEEYFARFDVEGANPSRCEADPVNSATGSLVASAGDLTLPGNGIAFEMARTYNSADETTGILGRGWTHSFNLSLSFPEDGVITYRAGDGQQIDFFEDLEEEAPGDWFRAGASHTEIERRPVGTECGGCTYVLRRVDQTFAHFDADGHLLQLIDRNGNGLTFSNDGAGRPTSVVDAAGRTITLGYHPGGLLASVTLPDGRDVAYGYTDGLLTTVTDVRGGTVTYRYDDELLVEETNARHQRVHLTDYDPVTGRAIRQEDGLGAVTTWAWNAETETSTMVDSQGGTWVDRYQDNVLQSSTDPLGRTTRFTYDARLNVVQTIDPAGAAVTQVWDDRGNLLRTTGPLGLTDVYTYDDLGNRTSWTRPDGEVITYGYDSLGRPASVDGPGTTSVTSHYDSEGLLEWTEDGEGRRTDRIHDAAGNETSMCTPLEHCTTKTYDASGRLLTVVGPNGNAPGGDPDDNRAAFGYDAADNRTSETDPLGRTTTYTYDAVGNVTVVEEPDGRTVTRTYDAADQMVTESIEGAPPTTFEYDGRGNLTRQVSPEGRTTRWTYDGAGQRTTVVDGEGATWRYTYDVRGRTTSVRDPEGGVTRVTYDAAGRVVRQVDPAGAAVTSTYDAIGNALSATDPTGATARRTYTPTGLVATETDPAGGVTTYGYDDAGNLVRTTTPTGEVTETEYDDDGRATAMTGPLGFVPGADPEDHTTHVVHDPAGNVVEVVDPLDRVTATTYDALGRALTVTAPGDRTTSYGYDEVGRQTSITTPDLAVTEWEFSAAGDLVRRVQPDGGDTTYVYDDDHLQVTETDALGRTWRVAYDDSGRPTATWDAIATVSGPSAPATSTSTYDRRGLLVELDHHDPATPDVTFGYDAAGRQISMRDGAGLQTHGYDAAGRLLEVRRGADVFTYDYDAAGRLASTTYPDGTEVGTSYDRSGRLKAVSAFGGSTAYDYDAGGRLTSIAFPNGVAEAHEHDALGRPTSTTVTRGETVVTGQERTYRADGTVETDVTPAGEATYLHDERDRLEDTCYGSCPSAAPSIRYLYDEAGNRVAEEADGDPVVTAGHDAADQIEDVLPTGGATFPVTHDGNGNVIDDGIRTYRYDGAGRLVEVAVSDPADVAGSIAGTVTDPSGAPLAGVVVRAYGLGREVTTAVTGPDGTYELNGLPATAYDVYFDDLTDGTHQSTWHGGATEPDGSVPVEVAPQVGSTADAVLAPVDIDTLLWGQVTDDEGAPIAGAQVTLQSLTTDWLRKHAAPFRHPVPVELGIGSLDVRPEVEGEWTAGAKVPVEAGQPIDVAVEVTNGGLVGLEGIEVAFPGVDLSCAADDADDLIDALAVDETVRCTGVATALVGDQQVDVTATTATGDSVEQVSGYVGMGSCTVTGTAGDDALTGTSGDDVICGLGGDDEIDGAGGADVIRGGPGADVLLGGPGADVLADGGGTDADELYGGAGIDLLHATGGNDLVVTEAGSDVGFGGAGNDVMMAGVDGSLLVGGTGANTMVGGSGFDQMRSSGSGGTLTGGLGGDWLFAEGADALSGGSGGDLLVMEGSAAGNLQGGTGEDLLLGGPGPDVLNGGGNADLSMGGPGVDTFPGTTAGVDMVLQDVFEGTTTADEDGRWSMRVPAGIYHIAVGADGFLGELWDDARWFPASQVAVLREVTAGQADVELATDPDWVEPPDPEPGLGDPGEVLARYTYDGAGNRVTARTPEGTTRYTWDVAGGLPRLATESGPDGEVAVAWGLGPVAVAEDGADPRYLHLDDTGSVTAVTDATGAVVGRAGYSPFGAVRWSEGSIVDGTIGGIPFGFAGEQLDAETGLYFLRARYYDPTWGRFTQPDPAGWVAGGGHESTYLYAGGSPLDQVDPSGLRLEAAERDRAYLASVRAAQQPQDILSKIDRFITDGFDIHMLLDAAGMIPGIGELADFANGLIYLTEGNYVDAAISFAAMVVGIGSAGTGARIASRYGDEIAAGTRMVARNGDEVAEAASKAGRLRRRLDSATDRITQNWDRLRAHPELGSIGGPPSGGRSAGRLGHQASAPGSDIVRYDADVAVGNLTVGGGARASDLDSFGSAQGWTRSQTTTGPIKYTDDNGVVRITIKAGSPRAPGSNFPHVEIRNAFGERIDPFGNPVTRKSGGNHTPIIWDL